VANATVFCYLEGGDMEKSDFDELLERIDEIEVRITDPEIKMQLRALRDFIVLHYPEGE